MQSIDDNIVNLDNRIDFLKSVVLETLKFHQEKKVNFPGIGSASRRTVKGTWVINDEKQLLDSLRTSGEYKNVIEERPVIVKSELNKLLDSWQSSGKPIVGVEKEDQRETVALSFDEKSVLDDAMAVIVNIPAPQKEEQNNEQLAKLNFK